MAYDEISKIENFMDAFTNYPFLDLDDVCTFASGVPTQIVTTGNFPGGFKTETLILNWSDDELQSAITIIV